MGSMSLWHWLIVALVAALVFGPKRLADLGKGLGEGIRGFKKGLEPDEEKKQLKSAEAKEPKQLE